MRGESTQTWPIRGECDLGPPRAGVGSVRVPFLSRKAAGLLLVGLTAWAWFTQVEGVRQKARIPMFHGESSVQTMSFVVSADGMKMATTDSLGRVALRDAGSGWMIEQSLPFPDRARVLAFAPDGRFLIGGGIGSGITLFDLESAAEARTVPVPVGSVKAVAFAPDGRTVAVAEDGAARLVLWNLAAGRVDRILRHPSPIQSIAFTPDGRSLASGGRYETPAIILWDLATGSIRLRFEETHGPIKVMAISPNGTWLATVGAFERCVRIRDLRTAGPSRSIEGHAFGTNGLAFSPDGRTLATAGNDGMVRLWDAATGRQQVALDGGAPMIGPVAFAAAGRSLLATSTTDHHLRVWDLAELEAGSSPSLRPEPGVGGAAIR